MAKDALEELHRRCGNAGLEAEAEEQSQMELVGDTLLERLNDVGAAVETKTQDRELLKKKDNLIKKLMWRIDPLLEENASLQAELEEQRDRKIVRWAEKALEKACRRSDRVIRIMRLNLA
jgi:predicted RNase H-like nuclease (RuvC/YqgF family)